MAVIETLKSVTGTYQLNNGTDSSGNVKTIAQSAGSLNKAAFDADKLFAIGALLAPCLSKAIYATEDTKKYTISQGD